MSGSHGEDAARGGGLHGSVREVSHGGHAPAREPDAAGKAALHVDWLSLPSGGAIGMTHCPGRRGVDGRGRVWQRDLQHDLDTLVAADTGALVTLIETREFKTLGVAELADEARRRFGWHHLPIADMHAPDGSVQARWQREGAGILRRLRGGERVVFHCAAGLGRTGTMVARLLVDAWGMTADEAIARVRQARPGTIESASQEDFVRGPVFFALAA